MTIIFDPHLIAGNTDVLIVGLGGTGSALARHVVRIVYQMKVNGLQTPKSIRFIDPDIVELKNVARQSFSSGDVGQHKAEVLARRFNMALGLEIEWFNEDFDPNRHVDSYSHNENTIILGCVDNYAARCDLAKAKALWIDCGNHHNSGQVIIGNTGDLDAWERHIKTATKTKKMKPASFVAGGVDALSVQDEFWRFLPNVSLVFPAMLQPESQPASITPMSCADLMALGEQSVLVNENVAVIAAGYLYKLMFRQPITSFMTFVDGDSLSMRSIPITRDDIEAYVGVA